MDTGINHGNYVKMRLYYFQGEVPNFGDDINPWFWENYFPGFFQPNGRRIFLGIGTLLNHRIRYAEKKIVCGAGFGYGTKPIIDDSWDFICVRGPLTAIELGLPIEKAIADPAILLPELIPPLSRKIHKISFMPHIESHCSGDWRSVCERANIYYIDPSSDFRKIISDINTSELLITESMHGAITADAYRTPWIAVQCSSVFYPFKWHDWALSLGIRLQIHNLPPVYSGLSRTGQALTLRNSLKLYLRKAGIQSDKWTPPTEAKSTPKNVEATVERLKYIVRKINPTISNEALLKDKQIKLHGAFNRFSEKYIQT